MSRSSLRLTTWAMSAWLAELKATVLCVSTTEVASSEDSAKFTMAPPTKKYSGYGLSIRTVLPLTVLLITVRSAKKL